MKQFYTISFLLLFTFLAATVINVPGEQPTIQTGIDTAVDADTVLVQPGTYVENINYNGKNITVASLFLTTQDTSYISQTTIDGNENGSVVTFESGEDSTAVLVGFTITNGLASGYVPECCGAGIYCEYSSPSLVNVTISDNFAEGSGGGIYCYQSSPDLENVTITNNDAIQGGGIYCEESNPRLDNVNIINNYTGGGFGNVGGGIFCWYSSPTLENVTISGNISCGGGGIWCAESNLSLTNVTISGNSNPLEGGPGGGIFCGNSSLSLVNVTISYNFADGSGGGIACGNSNPSLVNVTISDNIAKWGGGIFCAESNPILTNVTITDNLAEYYGGGIWCGYNSNPILVNCIMWNDTPEDIYFSPDDDPNSITISYSDIQGGEAGIVTNNNGTVNWQEGNMNVDPLFVGAGEDPYSLLEDSPCIDAGIPDTTGLNLPPWDIIGNLRIWDGDGNGSAIIDMGAYEYGAPPYVDVNEPIIPNSSSLITNLSNYPNPFNPTTTINYSLKENSKVNLSIYNIKGQKVKQLISGIRQLPEGQHSVVWNGKDENGKQVSTGIYFYKLKTEDVNQTKRMLMLK